MPRRIVLVALSVPLIFSLGIASVAVAAADPAVSDVWSRIRTAASTARGGSPLAPADSIPYAEIEEALEARIRALVMAEPDGGARTEALDDCRTAAQLVERLYGSPFLRDRVEWAAELDPLQAASMVEADSLTAAGLAALRQRDPESAGELLPVALESQERIGDEKGHAFTRYLIQSSPVGGLDEPGQVVETARLLEAARAAGNLSLAQRIARRLRYAREQAEDWDGAREAALVAYDLATLLRDEQRRYYWMGFCRTYYQENRFVEFADASRKGLEVAIALSDSSWMAIAYSEISSALYSQNILDSATVYEERCLAIEERIGVSPKTLAGTHYNLCLFHWYQSNLEKSLHHCERALEMAQELDDWYLEENAANIIGNIVWQGDLRSAIPWYERALAIADEHDDAIMQCYARANLGWILTSLGDHAAAHPLFQGSLEAYESIPEDVRSWDHRGLTLSGYSWVFVAQGDTAEAIRLATESYELAPQFQDADLGICQGGETLAHHLLLSGQLDRAAEVYRNVIASAKRIVSRREEWMAYEGLAEIAWRRSQPDSAYHYLDLAIQKIEEYREDLGSLGMREQAFGSVLAPYHSAIRFRIRSGDPGSAFDYLERMKARELLDLLAGGRVVSQEQLSAEDRTREQELNTRIEDLNRRIREDGALEPELASAREELQRFEERLFRRYPKLREARGRGEPISIRNARRMLAPDELALIYSVGARDVTMLAVSRDEIAGFELDIQPTDLRKVIREFVTTVETPPLPWASFDSKTAKDLHAALVAPASDLLDGKTRLCIVPDQELYALPFAALVTENDRYLVEQYSVYVVPSLSTLGSLRWKGSRGRRELLAIGNPDYGELAQAAAAATPKWAVVTLRGGHEPLPYSAEEIESISEVYAPQVRTLAAADAKESRVKEMISRYGVIHFATHGLLDDRNPLYSSLALAVDDEGDDGYLEAREVMKMELDADIVVLSACRTARGQITRGEGINGLLRSFFIAGVPTVVASLWSVEDSATARLMSEFHRRLRDGERPAESLSLAQREMIAAGDAASHPFFWAAFHVYGDSE